MPAITHLSDIWEHTITRILKHDSKSEPGIMIREWVIFNKFEDFNSLLNFNVDDEAESSITKSMTEFEPTQQNGSKLL